MIFCASIVVSVAIYNVTALLIKKKQLGRNMVTNTLDLASFIVSSIFSNVAPEIDAFMQFGETFPSLLQLEAPSKTFTELLSSVVGCPTKPTSIKTCYNCNKQGHIAKYCKYDILCKHCGECGHIQRDPSCCYLHTVGFRIAQNWF
jgi:hypothetical protein